VPKVRSIILIMFFYPKVNLIIAYLYCKKIATESGSEITIDLIFHT